jgi:Tfp pilus assembly protein PilV
MSLRLNLRAECRSSNIPSRIYREGAKDAKEQRMIGVELNSSRLPSRSLRLRGYGFTFIEVLFATIILGLGFIMIAAVFPAALQQGLTTADETTGTQVCRDALRQIQSMASNSTLPYPGTYAGSANTPVVPFGNWNFTVNGQSVIANQLAATGSQFFSADHRFAWMAYYRRLSSADPMAQIFIIALKNSDFANSDYTFPPFASSYFPSATTPAQPFPQPSPKVQFLYSPSTGFSYAVMISGDGVAPTPVTNAAPGAYVLVSDDNGGGNTPAGSMIGRVFRLGNQNPTLPSDLGVTVTTPGEWFQLQPGMDLRPGSSGSPEATPTNPIRVYIVGRANTKVSGVVPPLNPYTGPYVGGNQDIACVSAYVRINN